MKVTIARRKMILAFMVGLGHDIKRADLIGMLELVDPEAVPDVDWYIWHLINDRFIKRVDRGVYHLCPPRQWGGEVVHTTPDGNQLIFHR